ncbi:MAG: hypothetical protein HBSAPP03_18910 [Phycisphaerae bacterium]|nr:MAG: hypothetical protein HBSAPP03_18910 [Phycisphaerae bacterium]
MRIARASVRSNVRRMSHLAFGAGAVLLLLAVVAWSFPMATAWGTGGLALGRGSFVYVTADSGDLKAAWPNWVVLGGSQIALGPTRRWLPSTMSGFVRISSQSPGAPIATKTANVQSHWYPLWMFGGVILGLAGFGRYLSRGFSAGCCSGCGYDLRGLGTHPACPECGMSNRSADPRLAS